jgi:carbamoyltransferase
MSGIGYAEFTHYNGIGSALYKAGSMMGLASYGTVSEKIKNNLNKYVEDSYFGLKNSKEDRNYNEYYLNLWKDISKEEETFTKNIKKNKKIMNISADIQYIFENSIIDVINNIDNKKINNLCLSGGSMLNCNANTLIKQKTKFENIHHFPACGDDGTSVGAALYVAHHIYDEPRYKYNNKDIMYLGKKYEYIEPDYSYLASQISHGKIVAWFMGASEFGPRALGGRSIIADPRSFHSREIINFLIKDREWFRPIAPVVLEEECKEWFDFQGTSPFMLYTAKVLKPDIVPGITHIDGTARMQTINEETNLPYFKLIKEFYNQTGVPMLINTSLNGHAKPMVETEEDALDFFNNSDIDILVLNGKILTK